MLKSIEGNFDNPEVHELLTKHFIELRAASPEGKCSCSRYSWIER
jgi:putative acetyltransferase